MEQRQSFQQMALGEANINRQQLDLDADRKASQKLTPSRPQPEL